MSVNWEDIKTLRVSTRESIIKRLRDYAQIGTDSIICDIIFILEREGLLTLDSDPVDWEDDSPPPRVEKD